MNVAGALRWWPPVGVVAMIALGLAVGKGPTPVDDWFNRAAHAVGSGYVRWFLVLTDWWLLGPVLAACVVAALVGRRWRLAVVIAACPFAAIEISEAFKRLFEREKGGALAYPSGHMTLLVAVMGMVVLVAGARLWAVWLATAVSVLGMVALASSYHYLTDTIGASLLSTALVCIYARLAGTAPAPAGRPPKRLPPPRAAPCGTAATQLY